MFTISLWSAGALTYLAGNPVVAVVCLILPVVVAVVGMCRKVEDPDVV